MKNILLFIFIISLFTNCEKDETIIPCSCPEQLLCTEEYRSIPVEITDEAGLPYVLDEFYTTQLSDGQKITVTKPDPVAYTLGLYLVLEDRNLDIVDKCGEEFKFTGLKNGVEVISKTFTIKNNCCHIELMKGETKVVISK